MVSVSGHAVCPLQKQKAALQHSAVGPQRTEVAPGPYPENALHVYVLHVPTMYYSQSSQR